MRTAPLFAAFFALAFVGCQTPKTTPRPGAGGTKTVRADPAAQQKAYERGVARFAEEDYAEARKAWQESLKLGPATPLGRKSQENLNKVDAILKSLRAIEGGR